MRAVLHIVLGWAAGFFGLWALLLVFRPHTNVDTAFGAMMTCGVMGSALGLWRWHRRWGASS
jgi:hypothetical protein